MRSLQRVCVPIGERYRPAVTALQRAVKGREEQRSIAAVVARARWRWSCVPSQVVECWIGVEQDGDGRVVRLAGALGAAQVPDLLLACASPGALQIDLTELISIDAAGIHALQRVRARGAILVGVPGYIQLKLDSSPKHGTWKLFKKDDA